MFATSEQPGGNGNVSAFNKWRTLGVVCLATAMLMLDIAVVNTALPRIAHSLHSGLSGVEWVVDAYTLALASVVLSVGSLADRLGRRLVFAIGMVLFTATSLACALAGSIELLDAARAVQGIGGAMLFASSLAVLADAFPTARERASAFAFYGGTIGAAFAIGPAVGGALTTGFGWPAVFYVNLPLGVFALAATFAWLRESRDPNPRRIDVPGQLALSGGLLLLVLALLRGNDQGWGSAPILGELASAAVCLAGFVMIELRIREPMLPLSLFRRPAFTGAQVAAFTISASFFALFLYLTLYLQEVLHLSPLDAGLVYVPGTVVMFFVSGATAPLSARVSPGILIVAGLFLVAGGLALMLIAQVDSTWVALLPGELVVCIGTGIVNPALATVAISSLAGDQSGLAAGVNDAFRQAGVAVGVAAFGALVPAQAALGHGSPSAYVTGLHHAILIATAVAAVGAVVVAKLISSRSFELHHAVAPGGEPVAELD
jgi:EmrB/QacA subfamily drug resistance transporter